MLRMYEVYHVNIYELRNETPFGIDFLMKVALLNLALFMFNKLCGKRTPCQAMPLKKAGQFKDISVQVNGLDTIAGLREDRRKTLNVANEGSLFRPVFEDNDIFGESHSQEEGRETVERDLRKTLTELEEEMKDMKKEILTLATALRTPSQDYRQMNGDFKEDQVKRELLRDNKKLSEELRKMRDEKEREKQFFKEEKEVLDGELEYLRRELHNEKRYNDCLRKVTENLETKILTPVCPGEFFWMELESEERRKREIKEKKNREGEKEKEKEKERNEEEESNTKEEKEKNNKKEENKIKKKKYKKIEEREKKMKKNKKREMKRKGNVMNEAEESKKEETKKNKNKKKKYQKIKEKEKEMKRNEKEKMKKKIEEEKENKMKEEEEERERKIKIKNNQKKKEEKEKRENKKKKKVEEGDDKQQEEREVRLRGAKLVDCVESGENRCKELKERTRFEATKSFDWINSKELINNLERDLAALRNEKETNGATTGHMERENAELENSLRQSKAKPEDAVAGLRRDNAELLEETQNLKQTLESVQKKLLEEQEKNRECKRHYQELQQEKERERIRYQLELKRERCINDRLLRLEENRNQFDGQLRDDGNCIFDNYQSPRPDQHSEGVNPDRKNDQAIFQVPNPEIVFYSYRTPLGVKQIESDPGNLEEIVLYSYRTPHGVKQTESDPDHNCIEIFNGIIDCLNLRYGRAVTTLSKALTKVSVENVKGLVHLYLGLAKEGLASPDYKEIAEHCCWAIEYGQEGVIVHKLRAESLFKLKLFPQAKEDYDQVNELYGWDRYESYLDEIEWQIDNETLFDVLGVSRKDDNKKILRAYQKLAMVHHPDKNAYLHEFLRKAFQDRMKLITLAYSVLTDEEAREEYEWDLFPPKY